MHDGSPDLTNAYYTPERETTVEEQLREDNPGLKELWDQYQTMLELVRPAKEPKRQDSNEDLIELLRSCTKTFGGLHE